MKVPTKLLLAMATGVSTAVSMAGGFVLYTESLSILESTVESGSRSDIKQTANRFRSWFAEVEWTGASLVGYLERVSTPFGLHDTQQHFFVGSFPMLYHHPTLYGTGILVSSSHNTTSNKTGLYQLTWWDPVVDEDKRLEYPGGRHWQTGTYLPEQWADPACDRNPAEYPDSKKKCSSVRAINATTGEALEESPYNFKFSNPSIDRASLTPAQGGYMIPSLQEDGGSYWRSADVWSSIVDKTPYIYVGHMSMLSRKHAERLFGPGVNVMVVTFLSFHNWTFPASTNAAMVLSFVDDGLGSLVLATNVAETPRNVSCQRFARSLGSGGCFLTVKEIPETFSAAVVKANSTPAGTFMREGLPGGEYWLMRTTVFEPRQVDLLGKVSLTWAMTTSTINNDVERALLMFVCFVVAVFVFDCCILLTEIFRISMPLERATTAIAHLNTMDLESAKEGLLKVSGRGFQVREIHDLVRAMLFATEELRYFRSFLPEECLPDEDFVPTHVVAPGMGLSTASVAVCFTDIEGSTSLWEEVGDCMHDAVRAHNSLMRKLATDANGYEVKIIGDAFMLAFEKVMSACAFSLAVQEELLRVDWPTAFEMIPKTCGVNGTKGGLLWKGLRVRIGIHAGNARVERNHVTGRYDYFGGTVNVAARVEGAVARGGLVGITDAVLGHIDQQDLLTLGSPVVVPLGKKKLKGVTEAINISLLFPQVLSDRRAVTQDDGKRTPVQSPLRIATLGTRQASTGGHPGMDTCASNNSRGSHLDIPELQTSIRGAGRSMMKSPLTRLRSSEVSVMTTRCAWSSGADMDFKYVNFVATVDRAVSLSQGVVVGLVSSVITCVWNTASTPCSEFVSRCVYAMDQINGSCSFQHHVGAATGRVWSGSLAMAAQRQKRYAAVLGGVVELASGLAEESERCGDWALCSGDVVERFRLENRAFRAQLWAGGSINIVVWEVTPRDSQTGVWQIANTSDGESEQQDLDEELAAVFEEAVGNQDPDKLESALADLGGKVRRDSEAHSYSTEAGQRMMARLVRSTLKKKELPVLMMNTPVRAASPSTGVFSQSENPLLRMPSDLWGTSNRQMPDRGLSDLLVQSTSQLGQSHSVSHTNV
eukprot:Hpha_TRINITY_DN12254_c0_g1::TRINITY_DN12254_c0_g1_i1::g.17139::m.17139